MCYILCTTSPSVCYIASGVKGGLRDFIGPLRGGLGAAPLRKKNHRETCHIFASFFRVASIFMSIVGEFFGIWFFPMVFYFWLRN
jgi:hypothetical protein